MTRPNPAAADRAERTGGEKCSHGRNISTQNLPSKEGAGRENESLTEEWAGNGECICHHLCATHHISQHRFSVRNNC